jgi:hypothetical protein
MSGKTVFIMVILILLGIAGGYYLGTNYKLTLQLQGPVPTVPIPPPSLPIRPVSSPTYTPETTVVSPTIDDTALLIAAVRAGLVAEHGPDAASMTITVSKIVGNFAQGGASAQGGGGMWFAAKVGGSWKLVWDGNGTISCAKINPYNFPATLIPECFDDVTQKIVTR